MDKLTKEFLCDILEYKDGRLFWQKTLNPNRVKVGTEITSVNGAGYIQTNINRKNYVVHRLIFLMHHGYLPKYVDHINGVRTDNRIENLREATWEQNQHNSRIRSDNTSGVKGVCWRKDQSKWWVKLQVNGVSKHIGYFEDIELAELVSIEARNKYHKEFARNE